MKNKKKKSAATKDTKDTKDAKKPKKEEDTKEDTADPPTAGGTEDVATTSQAIEDDQTEPTSPDATPSLAQQSKMRSTSFRAGSGTTATSPGPMSPIGDTAPEIYKKHVAKIEELEKENKRLAKDATDAEKRWKKAEDELADFREQDDGAESGDKVNDNQTTRMVSEDTGLNTNSLLTASQERRNYLLEASKLTATTASFERIWSWPSTINIDGITSR